MQHPDPEKRNPAGQGGATSQTDFNAVDNNEIAAPKQEETALAAAMRRAAERKAVAR